MKLTLYELGAEDFSVRMHKNSQFGFDIEVTRDENDTIHSEMGVHPYAAESLAVFCRSYLRAYDKTVKDAE